MYLLIMSVLSSLKFPVSWDSLRPYQAIYKIKTNF